MAEKTLKVTATQIEGSVEKSHNHSNLSTLNNITSSRMSEWDDKADKEHRHNANEIDGLDNLDVNLSNYYTKTQVDNKIAEASLSGGNVDLSGYATKDDLNNLNVPTKTSQLTNDSNFIKSTDNIDADTLNNKKFSEVMTKEEYDALVTKDPNTIYLISDEENVVGGNVDLNNYYTKEEIDTNKANKSHTHAISEITDLAAKIASLETNITNLINTNTTLTNKVTALETKVTELDLQLNPPIVEKMYYGRLSAAEVGIPPVKQYSEITEEMILNGANITVSDPKTLNKESMGMYNSTAEGDYVIVAVPKSRNYTVTQDNGIGGKAPFDEETAGANGIDITIAGVECKLYGQILIAQGEIFVYVD